MDYGTGAIFGCPARDQRDLDFVAQIRSARSFRWCCRRARMRRASGSTDVAYVDDGTHDQFALPRRISGRGCQGRESAGVWRRRRAKSRRGAATSITACATGGVSRQRYWGCPIPMVHCDDLRHRAGRRQAELPVQPARRRHLRQAGQSAGSSSDLEAHHLSAAAASRRGARPIPSIPSSTPSWYFARFCSLRWNGCAGRSPKRSIYWLPVDQYIGGVEHAILHLLYSRFFTRAMQLTASRRPGRAVRRPVHPGHGAARILQGRERQVAVPGRGREGRKRQRGSRHHQGAGPGRPQGGDVEIEEERGAAGPHHRDLRR